jgi:hypothetical protein
MTIERQVVPCITVNSKGQALVEARLNDVLFDLALKLEEITYLPVDVQHVVAAIVLAGRRMEISADHVISVNDPLLVSTLTTHVKSVFALYGGEVGNHD